MPKIDASITRKQTIGNGPGEVGMYELPPHEQLRVSLGSLNGSKLLILLAEREDDTYLSMSPRLSVKPDTVPVRGPTPMPIVDARLEIDIDGAVAGSTDLIGASRWWNSGELIMADGLGHYIASMTVDGLGLSGLATSETTPESRADETIALDGFNHDLETHLHANDLPQPVFEVRCEPQSLGRPVLLIANRGVAPLPIDVR